LDFLGEPFDLGAVYDSRINALGFVFRKDDVRRGLIPHGEHLSDNPTLTLVFNDGAYRYALVIHSPRPS